MQRAAQIGSVAFVEVLAEVMAKHSCSLNTKGAYGYTALHEACYHGRPGVIKCLLEKNANVDALSKNGSTPLLVAAREGKAEAVRLLIAHRAHPDDGGDKGWTPLSVAASEAHFEVCQVLLEKRANVNGFVDPTGRGERSSLQEAVEQCKPDPQGIEDIRRQQSLLQVVKLLVAHKADANHSGSHSHSQIGQSAMQMAFEEKNQVLLHLLQGGDQQAR